MNLKKKVGPLPMWAWVLIVGTTIGLLWYEHSKSSSSSSSSSTTAAGSAANQIDPATGMTYAEEAAYQSQGIDPLTGQTYASEYGGYGSSSYGGGTGLTDTGSGTTTSYPSLATEIADVTSAAQGLQALGLLTAAPAAQAGPAQNPGPSTSTPTSGTVKHITDILKGGAKITNFKPHPTKNHVTRGIGNGLYETTIKHTATHPKTKVSGQRKRQVTTGRVGGAHRMKG